jgi:glycosyltransferase involved in cell wall biosynthesis
MAPRLWIDVEDLFEYARANLRPSGIQRLAFEIYRTMQARPDCVGLVRFVRHDFAHNSFRIVEWAEIAELFAGLTTREPEPLVTRRPGKILPHSPARKFARSLLHRLPPSIRVPAIDVLLAQAHAFGAWGRLLRALIRGALEMPRSIARRLRQRRIALAVSDDMVSVTASGDTFARLAAPGDILLVFGAPWSHPNYAALIRAQRERGLKFALLIYDLIPLRRPEWCDRGLVRLFRAWFDSVLPLCDYVFAISRATAADTESDARERNIVLPGPVLPIPIGTGFGAEPLPKTVKRADRLPAADSYALIVSTIEARKNHLLLFRVWRRMLEEMPRDRVPTLVFAGRVGWLVQDLIQQIANTDYLDGKLVLIENPTDAEVSALYEGCLFTLFPSFYEGWGLPVTESLAFGKPCVIADRTSLPEAGGSLARSFDPDDLNDAYAVIRGVIEDRAELARWERQVRREFKPVPWAATVEALFAGLDHPLAAPLPELGDSKPELEPSRAGQNRDLERDRARRKRQSA